MPGFFIELFCIILALTKFGNGFYNTSLMKGSTPSSYVLSTLLPDFVINLFFFEALWLSNVIFGIDTSGW